MKKVNIRKDVLGSLFASFLLMSQNLLQISSFVFKTTLPYWGCLALFAGLSLLLFYNSINRKDFLLILLIFLCFGISKLLYDNDELPNILFYFLAYGGIGFLISLSKTKAKVVCVISLIIGSIWLLLNTFNELIIDDSFSFGYLILPVVCVSLCLALETYKHKFWNAFFLFLFVVYLAVLLFEGSRGPFACLVIYILLLIFPLIKNLKRGFWVIVLYAVILILLFSYDTIIISIHDKYPGTFSLIDKSYKLITTSSDISNGRLEIYQTIFKEYKFLDFITGIGIGSFESAHPVMGYTHNLYLSIVLDYGLIGLVYIIYITIAFFKRIYKKRDNYLILVFTLSVVHLLFSGTYWELFVFWYFLFVFNRTEPSILEKVNIEYSRN